MSENNIKEIVEKYTEIINELDPAGQAERTPSFCNEVSQLVYDRYDLNAASETQVNEAFISALDNYFN